MATGVEDDVSLKANRAGFSRFYLRPRRLVDITRVDTSIELFGKRWDSPVGLAPIGNMMAFHTQGEMPVARAAKATGTLQILSTMTNSPIENVNEALGRPVWYQLYTSSRWEITEQLVRRAEAAGTEVILVTVDTQAGSRRETFERMRKLDKRECSVCHGSTPADFYKRKAMFRSVDVTGISNTNASMTWKDIDRLKKMTRAKLLVKGIETREDALLCVESGADGLVVSNHGGRAGDTGRGTIECLPEVVDGVGGRVPVLIDGGFRRGSDVFKALALGAKAVCIGRPYIWGLAPFGQAGVERVIHMIRAELQLVMKQCGARSIAEIGTSHVGRV
jgi:isopentenyl diphosphate isomerase/L-lactate dehydrogenase-like FMN-dependent dehydrogenase